MTSFEETDISVTAVVVAHSRAMENSRPDALFRDEFAELFVTASGIPLTSLGVSDMTATRIHESVVVRTHWLDAVVAKAVSGGVQQVVLLAAGLDTRALRLDVPAGTRFFELDLPKLLSFKRTVLEESGVECGSGRVEVPSDLADANWSSGLVAAGFKPEEPTVWLAEGLLIYFGSEDNDKLIAAITELSAPGSRLAFNHLGLGSQTEVTSIEMTRRTASNGYGIQSWIAEPKSWLAQWGWAVDATTIKAYGAALGRSLPYSETPGQEIAWLVNAELLVA